MSMNDYHTYNSKILEIFDIEAGIVPDKLLPPIYLCDFK